MKSGWEGGGRRVVGKIGFDFWETKDFNWATKKAFI